MDYKPKFSRQFSCCTSHKDEQNSMELTHDDTMSNLIPTTTLPEIIISATNLPECKNDTCDECQITKKLEEKFQIEKQRCSML